MIPPLVAATGYLPQGIHAATVREIAAFFCGTDRRKMLWRSFQDVLSQFYSAGIDDFYIAGSFSTSAPRPSDIDAVWTYKDGFDPGKVDPVLLDMNAWIKDPTTGLQTRLMKLKYKVELWMHPGILNDKSVLDFFSTNRDGKPRGILKIIRSDT